MSWTRITEGSYIPRKHWVGGYDDQGVWHQTKAWVCLEEGWLKLDRPGYVSHSVTHWAPFEAPEPPPKPVSARKTGDNLIAWVKFLLTASPHQIECCKNSIYEAIDAWDDCITREEARGE